MAEERCSARLRKYLLEQAKVHAVARDWESAFSHYLLAIKVDCTTALEIEAAFAFCFEQWLAHLRSVKQEDEICNAFIKAKAVCFFSDSLMSLLAYQAMRCIFCLTFRTLIVMFGYILMFSNNISLFYFVINFWLNLEFSKLMELCAEKNSKDYLLHTHTHTQNYKEVLLYKRQ